MVSIMETNITTIFTSTVNSETIEETTDIAQNVVEAVGNEVSHVSSIFSHMFSPFKNALPSILVSLVFALIGMFLIKWIMRIIGHGINRLNMDKIASGFFRSLIKIILYMILVVIVLSILDFPMDSIVAVIASAGVAISLAIKDSLSNLAGGFILLFAKPIKQGDTIQIDGEIGKVESIDILYTKIVTPDNAVVFLPNGKTSTAKIINYTDKDTRRVDLQFGISYESEIDKARAVIMRVVQENDIILTDPEPTVVVSNHNDSAVELLTRVWVPSDEYWTVYYKLYEDVKTAFDKNNISIPYPHVDVHVDNVDNSI